MKPLTATSLAGLLLLSTGCPRAPSGAADAILGPLSTEQLLSVDTAWLARFEEYRPDSAAVDRIRAVTARTRGQWKIVVVLGTWCQDCRRHVPAFLKMKRLLAPGLLPAEFVGVDRDKKSPADWVAKHRIERVPTFVVLRKGVEVGRIVENPAASIEADLAQIVERAAAG